MQTPLSGPGNVWCPMTPALPHSEPQRYKISNSFTGEEDENTTEFIFSIKFDNIPSGSLEEMRMLLDILGQDWRTEKIYSASHTTTPSEQQEWQNASLRDSEKFICQSERDKVLDEFTSILMKRCCNSIVDIEHADIPTIHLDELAGIIKELLTPTEAHR